MRNYIVKNKDVLEILDNWKTSNKKQKLKIESRLINDLTYFIQSKIKQHKGKAFYDDLVQEGRLGISKAVKDFNPERGLSFFKFANWHIQSRMKSFLSKEINLKEIPVENNVLDIECENLNEKIDECELKYIVNESLNLIGKKYKIYISERFGIGDYAPSTLQQMGDRRNITREGVRQNLERALTRLKNDNKLYRYVNEVI